MNLHRGGPSFVGNACSPSMHQQEFSEECKARSFICVVTPTQREGKCENMIQNCALVKEVEFEV